MIPLSSWPGYNFTTTRYSVKPLAGSLAFMLCFGHPPMVVVQPYKGHWADPTPH